MRVNISSNNKCVHVPKFSTSASDYICTICGEKYKPSDNKDGLVALDEGHCIQYLSSQDKMRGNLSTKATVEAVYCAVRLLCSTFGTPPKRDEVSVNDIEAMINANIELKKQDYDGGIEYVIKGIEKSAQSIHRLIYGEKQEKLI